MQIEHDFKMLKMNISNSKHTCKTCKFHLSDYFNTIKTFRLFHAIQSPKTMHLSAEQEQACTIQR
jgi:hypothetical protein